VYLRFDVVFIYSKYMADDIQSIVKEIEKELVEAIVSNIEQNRMTKQQAQYLARQFLSLLPIEDKHSLLEKLGVFSKLSADAKNIYLKYGSPIENEERQQKLALMSEHIQNGQLEHALTVAKGGTINGGN
jgi:hypothetical protein